MRKDLKRTHVAGAEEAEVPMVERRNLRFVEPLNNTEDGVVVEADIGIRVPVADLGYSPVVGFLQILDLEGTRFDIV